MLVFVNINAVAFSRYKNTGTKSFRSIRDQDELERYYPQGIYIKFKYCKNTNRFLVFRDGLKIDSSDYKIVFPTQSTAFSDISIYFNKELWCIIYVEMKFQSAIAFLFLKSIAHIRIM